MAIVIFLPVFLPAESIEFKNAFDYLERVDLIV